MQGNETYSIFMQVKNVSKFKNPLFSDVVLVREGLYRSDFLCHNEAFVQQYLRQYGKFDHVTGKTSDQNTTSHPFWKKYFWHTCIKLVATCDFQQCGILT